VTDIIAPTARIVEAGTGVSLSGAALRDAVRDTAHDYTHMPAGVVLALTPNSLDSVLRYVGALAAGRPIALLDPTLETATLTGLVERLVPAAVVGLAAPDSAPPTGYAARSLPAIGSCWIRTATAFDPPPHPELAVLLATSGSTGNPKFVRLSMSGLVSNAAAIASVLQITEDDVAPTNLPLFYSYGMSVMNSHLWAGADLVVVDGGLASKAFWDAATRWRATSLAGVPYHFEMLRRIRWTAATQPTLRYATQAGGAMHPEVVTMFSRQLPLYVMYGQTEAGPRMTTLPSAWLPEKVGSVGPPLPGGAVSILTADGRETSRPGVEGEIVYRGPNVMMGYAESAADLALADQNRGVLHTGDYGRLDSDGCLWITGRHQKFGKVFGVRVNLTDIEMMLRDIGPAAAVAGDDTIIIFCEGLSADRSAVVASALAERLRLPRAGFEVRPLDRLPMLPNGKVDYRTLSL
jgi:acyl-coenzyme A synthetase/AMP-(fatty) acid ligase